MTTVMEGPLAALATSLAGELERLGYAKRTAVGLMNLAGELSRWLDGNGLRAGDLSPKVVEGFLATIRAEGRWFKPTVKTLRWLLAYLAEAGITPPPAPAGPSSPEDEVVQAYRRYLVMERGLAAGTVERRMHQAEAFLARHPTSALGGLTAVEVTAFMTRQCGDLSVGSAKLLATALRSFLSFCHLEGLISRPLSGAVPSAAGWSGGGPAPRAYPRSDGSTAGKL